MRIFNLLLVGCVVALAFAMYELKYDSRALEQQITDLRNSIQAERDAVAVLRAEWSHLNRPERLAQLARKHLGLKPLKASQLLTHKQYAAVRQPTPAEVAARLLGRELSSQKHRQAALR